MQDLTFSTSLEKQVSPCFQTKNSNQIVKWAPSILKSNAKMVRNKSSFYVIPNLIHSAGSRMWEIEKKYTLLFAGDSNNLCWFFFTGLVNGFRFFLRRTFFKSFNAQTSDAGGSSLDASRSTVLSFAISDLESLEILGEFWSCFALSACKCEGEIQHLCFLINV